MKISSHKLLIVLLSLPIIVCVGLPQRLRRYKICNGAKCKAIRSFKTPNFLQEMDTFVYSRWTRWSTCTRQCKTKRSRSCKFPLMCGNTVVQEEAFCYHRGTYCEYIFENNQQDYFSDDYEPSDYEIHSNEKGLQFPEHFSLSDFEKSEVVLDSPVAQPFMNSDNSRRRSEAPGAAYSGTQRNGNNDLNRQRHRNDNDTMPNKRKAPSRNGLEISDPESERPFPVDDYDHLGPSPTCGVPRITERNRNGIAMRILGGQEARQGRWPWQVAVLNKLNEAFCGGTLIAPRWILTAAHCIRKRLQVVIGEHHLHRDDGTERHYKIEAAFIHPDFDHETVDNDIALLLLPEPVPTDAGLACLPSELQALPAPGTLCTILGWGKERHTHVFGTTVLHEGKVPLVGMGECRYTYGQHEITSNMFCAGYRGGTVDSCAGDSGGPILCSVDSRWTVFGVTSFGDGCGRKGKYGIYAKVPNYVQWINKVMKANDYAN